jgi:hypothetical protein
MTTQMSRRDDPVVSELSPAEESFRRMLLGDETPAVDRQGARINRWVHESQLDAIIYARLLRAQNSGSAAETAFDFVEQHLERLAPRDPLERMLAVQLLWQHVRIATLCVQETQARDPKEAAAIRANIEQAMNTFRRQVQSLRELQSPRSLNLIRGGQVNVGDGQVVTNNQLNAERNSENELGFDHGDETEVPALAGGADSAPAVDRPRQALDAVHGAQDGCGQGRVAPKRPQARAVQRGGSCR